MEDNHEILRSYLELNSIKKIGGKIGQIVAIDRDDLGKKYTYYRLIIKRGSM